MTKRTERRKDGRKPGLRTLTAAGLLLGLAIAFVPAAAGQELPAALDYHGLPSARTAVTLSVVGTLGAVLSASASNSLGIMALMPLFAGPSLGAMYGGLWGRALLFTGLRAMGTYALVAAALRDEEDAYSLAMVWVGGMAVTAVIETATVGRAVHRRNERLARRRMNLDLTPFALPKGAGVQVRLSF